MIVEDGSIVPGANSYATIDEADAYFTQYNNQDWLTETTENKELCLITATQSLELLYGQQYLSMPQRSDQSLLFPRFTFVINMIQMIRANQIPKQIKQSVFEIANMYRTGADVFPQPNLERNVKSTTMKVGDITTQDQYWNAPNSETFAGFNKVDLILAPILKKKTQSLSSLTL